MNPAQALDLDHGGNPACGSWYSSYVAQNALRGARCVIAAARRAFPNHLAPNHLGPNHLGPNHLGLPTSRMIGA